MKTTNVGGYCKLYKLYKLDAFIGNTYAI